MAQDFNVSIVSTNKKVQAILAQIEKYMIMYIWVQKALALLQDYKATLDGLTKDTDPVIAGKLLQSAEAYFMTSVSLYLRCFLDQEKTKLQINDLTTDASLIECYNELMKLRHDEFVHWKGLRSSIQCSFVLTVENEHSFKIQETINAKYNDSMGFYSTDKIKTLFEETLKHIDKKRMKMIPAIHSVLLEPNWPEHTNFLEEDGNPLFKFNNL